MIIRALRAENFMKFSALRVAGIPERGVIGIEGPNESGKTTIGEAVLFALFGKTRTSLETSVSRLIRWGADYLSVELEFDVAGRGQYLIYREIDKYGTNFVKVIDRISRAEVASGNVNVSEFLARTLKFDFYEFHQSFYHDQGQRGFPGDGQSTFVERMCGIAQIQEAAAGIKKDIEGLEREFALYQKDIQRNLQQVEKYERNIAKLPELRESARAKNEELQGHRGECRRRQAEAEATRRLGEERGEAAKRLESLVEGALPAIQSGLEDLRAALGAATAPPAGSREAEGETIGRLRSDLRAHLPRIDAVAAMANDFQALRGAHEALHGEIRARLEPEREGSEVHRARQLAGELAVEGRRRHRASIAAAAAFLLALFTGGPSLALFAGLDLKGIAGGAVTPEALRWAAAGLAAVCLAVFGVSLARRSRAQAKEQGLRQLLGEQEARIRIDGEERDRLGPLLAVSGPGEVIRFIKASEGVADPELQEARREFLRRHGPLVQAGSEGEYRGCLQALARMEREIRARAQRECQRLEKLGGEADGAAKKSSVELERIESEIRECEAQSTRRDAMLVKNRDLHARSQEVREAIELRRLSIELLEDAAASIRNKIGPSFSRALKELLPRLTRGRYRDIKVGSDLSIQIFTGEKSDFLDLAELSGGTNEALALALRLAISQAFISSRTHQAQFVFLDEPFKMMDEGRALEAIGVLPQLSGDLPQIFVVQPDFTGEQRRRFDLLLQTGTESLELTVDGGALAPPGASGLDGREGGSLGIWPRLVSGAESE